MISFSSMAAETRDTQIVVRVSPSERRVISQACERLGLSVSSWLRYIALRGARELTRDVPSKIVAELEELHQAMGKAEELIACYAATVAEKQKVYDALKEIGAIEEEEEQFHAWVAFKRAQQGAPEPDTEESESASPQMLFHSSKEKLENDS